MEDWRRLLLRGLAAGLVWWALELAKALAGVINGSEDSSQVPRDDPRGDEGRQATDPGDDRLQHEAPGEKPVTDR
jgi:hypothetical protein